MNVPARMILVAAFLCSLATSAVATAQAAPPRVLKVSLSQKEFEAEMKKRVDAGFRPIDVTVGVVEQNYVLAGVWEKRSIPEFQYALGLTSAEFSEENARLEQDGYRIVSFGSANVGGGVVRHHAIWDKRAGFPAYVIEVDLDRKEFERRVAALAGKQHKLLRISVIVEKETPRFAGVWSPEEESVPQMVESIVPAVAVERRIAALNRDGFRLVQVCAYVRNGRVYNAILAEKTKGPLRELTSRSTASDVAEMEKMMRGRGFVPVRTSVCTLRDRPRFGVLWEKSESAQPE